MAVAVNQVGGGGVSGGGREGGTGARTFACAL